MRNETTLFICFCSPSPPLEQDFGWQRVPEIGITRSTGPAGIGGASVPTILDVVYFNGNGLGNCTIDSDLTKIELRQVPKGIYFVHYTGQVKKVALF